jgi:hypothetical protein
MRHAADFNFCGEQATIDTADPNQVGVGGLVVYSKNVALPSNQKTMFVTISSGGDAHDGAAIWFSASVNNAPCNRLDSGAAGAPNGWVALQKHLGGTHVPGDGGGGDGDLHDNGIYYTWCCIAGLRPGGNNLVEVRMATSDQGKTVFIERSHWYVDSVGTVLCTNFGSDEAKAMEMMRSMPANMQQQPPKKQ